VPAVYLVQVQDDSSVGDDDDDEREDVEEHHPEEEVEKLDLSRVEGAVGHALAVPRKVRMVSVGGKGGKWKKRREIERKGIPKIVTPRDWDPNGL
jgi:hypothetical protein